MAKKNYSIHHQRLVRGAGYVDCEPHAASRIVLIETTNVPARHGRRAHHIKRILQTFAGAGAQRDAEHALSIKVAKTGGRPVPRIWGRSLTTNEYNARSK